MKVLLSIPSTQQFRTAKYQQNSQISFPQKAGVQADSYSFQLSFGNLEKEKETIEKIEQLKDSEGIKNLKFVDKVELINKNGEKCTAFAFCNKDIADASNKKITLRIFDQDLDYVGYLNASLNDNKDYAYISHINNYYNNRNFCTVPGHDTYNPSGIRPSNSYRQKTYKNVGKELYKIMESLIKKIAPKLDYMEVNADVANGSAEFHRKMGFSSSGKSVFSQFDNEYLIMFKKLI